MSAQVGTLISIKPEDPRGPYLVQFEDGLRYRYQSAELKEVQGRATDFNNLKTA
jgi:hypothetical protein